MAKRLKYALAFAPEVVDHLDAIDAKHQRLIQEVLDEQLSHTPATETRNRKPLRQPAPFGSTWELRCGPQNRFRVFYRIEEDDKVVLVLAIGVKEGSQLFIGGEAFET